MWTINSNAISIEFSWLTLYSLFYNLKSVTFCGFRNLYVHFHSEYMLINETVIKVTWKKPNEIKSLNVGRLIDSSRFKNVRLVRGCHSFRRRDVSIRGRFGNIWPNRCLLPLCKSLQVTRDSKTHTTQLILKYVVKYKYFAWERI